MERCLLRTYRQAFILLQCLRLGGGFNAKAELVRRARHLVAAGSVQADRRSLRAPGVAPEEECVPPLLRLCEISVHAAAFGGIRSVLPKTPTYFFKLNV